MRKGFVSWAVAGAVALYVGLLGGNIVHHVGNYRESLRASQSLNNPVELRKACREYAESELKLLRSWRILNPSIRGEPKPYEPVFRLRSQE